MDALDEDERARYLELAVFPDDARIPPSTVARLWQHSGGLDAAGSEKLLARFHRRALFKRVAVGETEHAFAGDGLGRIHLVRFAPHQ